MLQPDKKYYLYSHIRLDKNEIFYIGIGSKPPHYTYKCYKRAYSKYSRNRFWWFIVNKTDYRIEILEESEDYEYVKNKEIELIKLYGRKNLGTGTLCNLTDGGDYKCGYHISEETKEKIRKATKGKIHTKEAIAKMNLSKFKPVLMKDQNQKDFKKFKSVLEACDFTKLSRSAIDSCIKKKKVLYKGVYKGYTFEHIIK